MLRETRTFAQKYCNGKYKYHRGANKCQRKPKGQSRMNNPEKPATLGTQDTGRGQAKQKKTQHIKTKPMSNTDPTKLLKWTESGGQVSRDDRRMWCGKPTSKQLISSQNIHLQT